MGYAVLDPDELEAWDHPERSCELRSISHATALSNLGANLFDADPGEQLPLAYHYHEEQEELFFVLSGTLSVETPEEVLTVETGEVCVVEPESPQRAFVAEDAAEPARVLAVGAPRADDVREYEPDGDGSEE